MTKNKTSVKMSEENIAFWKKLNVNCIKANKITEILSYSDLQEAVVRYFKMNNDRYIELIEVVQLMEERKNGS